MLLLCIYILFTLSLNLYEIIVYNNDWNRIMLKNNAYVKTTLLHTFITYPISLIISDYYYMNYSNIVLYEYWYIEIIKFLIGINLFDFITFVIHILQHKFMYKYHSQHHHIHDTCIFFAYYIDMTDLLLTTFPFIIIPKILNFSLVNTYILICFNILFGSYAHHLYSKNGTRQFQYHNFHHCSPKHNFATGYPFIIINFDKLFGTYYDTKLI